MSTVADVIAFLEKFAPPELAEDWDNTGLLVGRTDAAIERGMTCLTLTSDVADEAVARGVQLVVSHHPLMFRGAKQITSVSDEGRVLMRLIECGIAVYSPHTSFDSTERGINQQLAESFGLRDVGPLRPAESSATVGGGRLGSLSTAVALGEFLPLVQSAVGGAYVEYCGQLDARVSRVAVACGSAADFLADAVQLECDTFVTGEARFHSALSARAAGINLVLLGHYSSERPAVENLAGVLGHEFPGVEFAASSCECDPLSVFTS